MSHVSKYKHKVKDFGVLKSVLDSKGIKYRENCMASLYGSNKVKAEVAFTLPGWKYEVAVTSEGELMYDHFGSSSGTFHLLGETVKDYNKEVTMQKVYGLGVNWWEEEMDKATKLVLEY